ncbi:MAG: tandem-95 repeat protein, partial [Phycisphaerales bacterium]|nr:tandem-95 repeat protein [Phycisphaerales bacterium]
MSAFRRKTARLRHHNLLRRVANDIAGRLSKLSCRSRQSCEEGLEPRRLLSAVSWTGNHHNGLWADSLNWTGGSGVPTAADNVTIGPGFSTITVDSGTQHAHTLSSASAIQIIGGTLDVTGAASLSANLTVGGGTLRDATVTISAGATLLLTNSGGILDAVTVNGTLDASQQNAAYATILGGLVLNGTAYLGQADGSTYAYLYFGDPYNNDAAGSLTGNATLLFGGSGNNAIYNYSNVAGVDGTLTLGSTVTIHGSSGGIYNIYSSASILNQGTINADTAGGTITVGNSSGSFANSGLVEATAGALNLGGIFTASMLGDVRSVGGPVNVTGTMNGDLSLNAQTGSWNLQGGTLAGGTLSETGGSGLLFTNSGGVLDGMTVNADLNLASVNGANVTVLDGLMLNGTAYLGQADGSTYGQMYFGDGANHAAGSLGGNAVVVFGASSNNALYDSSNLAGTDGTLTLGPTATVRGIKGIIGNFYASATVINQGLIESDNIGGSIQVGNGTNTFVNQGTIQVANFATLTLGGAWSSSGTIGLTQGELDLGGVFTQPALGTFNRSGGTVNITGILTGG